MMRAPSLRSTSRIIGNRRKTGASPPAEMGSKNLALGKQRKVKKWTQQINKTPVVPTAPPQQQFIVLPMEDVSPTPSLEILPEDIYFHIFSFLSTDVLLRTAGNVCAKWRTFCAYPLSFPPDDKEEGMPNSNSRTASNLRFRMH